MLTEKNVENRKKGIGASEAAIVLGLDDNVSPYQLWLVKTGRAPAPDLSHLPQVEWGTILEEPIAQQYAKVKNCRVRRVTETLFHPHYPFILCHIDRKIEGLKKLLECKFAMFARDDWGQTGSDVVPMKYIVQVQHQLGVTGYQEGDLAALIGGWDFRVYPFKRDEELINFIFDKLKEFWKFVETDTPPPLRDRVDASLAYPFSNGNFKDAEPEVIKAIEKFREVRAQTKALEQQKEELSNVLTLFMQDAEGIRLQNEVLATWKPTVKGNRVLKIMEARL